MTIGLVYAMPGEIETLLTDETRTPIRTEAGVSFYQIRPHIIACCCGVSKVNAAMGAQLLISLYHPDLVLNAGVAGCFENVPIGTIVLAEGFVQHDVDTTAVGDPIGLVSTVNQVAFPTWQPECCAELLASLGHPAVLPAAKAAMDATGVPYRTGWVATGDWFATDTPRSHWIADTFHPLLCEMEGCAVAQVCLRNGVKFMAIKSVSDCLFEHHDFAFNFPAAMKDLNRVVMAFLTQLTKE